MSSSRVVPALLSGSAVILAAVLMSQANAEEDESPRCEGDEVAVIHLDFGTDAADALLGTDVQAAEVLAEIPLVDVPASGVDYDSVDPSAGEESNHRDVGARIDAGDETDVPAEVDAAVTATAPDGELLAVIRLEGSADDGWRPAQIVRCLP